MTARMQRRQKAPEQLRIVKVTLTLHLHNGKKMVRNLKPTASLFVMDSKARGIIERHGKAIASELRQAELGEQEDLFHES